MIGYSSFIKKEIFVLIGALVIGAVLSEPICAAPLAGQRGKSLSTDVTVDAYQNLGEMPEIFKTGVFEAHENYLSDKGLLYLQEKYFSDLSPGMTTIFVPLWSESFDDFKRKVERERVLEAALREAKKVISGGGRVLFDLQIMPRWLSSNIVKGEFWRYPPKNYDTWMRLVAYTVNYFYSNGVRGAGYRIWEEVDVAFTKDLKFWNGTKEEFCKLYEYSVRGIRSVDPNAKVTFGLADYNNEILSILARYVTSKDLPLDYIIWHPFITPPYPHEYEHGVEGIKKVLKRSGLNKNVAIHAESWNSWLEFGKPDLKKGQPDSRSRERDSEYNAAYTVQTLYAQDAGGVTYHAFFDRIDHSYGLYLQAGLIDKNQQFFGDWGMFTKDLVIKPVFNAFRALSLLSGKEEQQTSSRLKAEFDETDFITAIASQTKDKSKMRVLLVNYIPPDKLLTKEYGRKKQNKYLQRHYGDAINPLTACLSKGGSLKDCESLAPEDLKTYFSCINAGEKDKCSALMPEHLHQFIQDTTEYMKQQKQRPKEIVLSLKNIPFSGKASLTVYTVDKDHSNSCRYNKSTERKSTGTECGVNGTIDTMITQARKEAEDITRRIVKEHSTLSPKMKEIGESLFYFGRYTLPDGKVIKNSIYIDKINNDPRVSLEGSKQIREISIDKSGSYSETIAIQPEGVMLVELAEVKK